MFSRILILLTLTVCAVFAQDCGYFKKVLKEAKALEASRVSREKLQEDAGFVLRLGDIGFERAEIHRNKITFSNTTRWYQKNEGNLVSAIGRLIADDDLEKLANINEYQKCYSKTNPPTVKSHPRYRPANGYGNNLKNPYWGTMGAPFGRINPKNYDDGVLSPRMSIAGNSLPNPRRLVQKVLFQAEIEPRTSNIPNTLFNLFSIFIKEDIGDCNLQKPHKDKKKDVRCCTHNNEGILCCYLKSSSCMPIDVDIDDPFYKDHGVRCLGFLRSDKTSLPGQLNHGEIMNTATAYLDLSLVYGNEDDHVNQFRTYSGGQLRTDSKNFLAVDDSGRYFANIDSVREVPLYALWPALFAQNHNKIAAGLASSHPSWGDNQLYNESRRINIAVAQSIFIEYAQTLLKDGMDLNLPYSDTTDILSHVEFHTGASRIFHKYLNSDILLKPDGGDESTEKFSDKIGDMPFAANNFDALINGALEQTMNVGEYSEQIINRYAKRADGVGYDLVAVDVNRGRDHGLPTYLQARAQCGLRADYTSFDELSDIFPQNDIDLLQAEYDSVQDIDLLVGGALETLLLDEGVVGETFECIIRDQFRRIVAGDAYFFTHSNSPYPFTAAQIAAIRSVNLNNLICANSGVQSVPTSPYFVPNNSENPQKACSEFPPLSLEAFRNIK